MWGVHDGVLDGTAYRLAMPFVMHSKGPGPPLSYMRPPWTLGSQAAQGQVLCCLLSGPQGSPFLEPWILLGFRTRPKHWASPAPTRPTPALLVWRGDTMHELGPQQRRTLPEHITGLWLVSVLGHCYGSWVNGLGKSVTLALAPGFSLLHHLGLEPSPASALSLRYLVPPTPHAHPSGMAVCLRGLWLVSWFGRRGMQGGVVRAVERQMECRPDSAKQEGWRGHGTEV